jgi:hypothetical protein
MGVAAFPDKSLTASETVNVPSSAVYTGFEVTMREVRSPSMSSAAVAPASA